MKYYIVQYVEKNGADEEQTCLTITQVKKFCKINPQRVVDVVDNHYNSVDSLTDFLNKLWGEV